MKTAKTKATSDALKILGRDDDSEMRAAIDEQVVRSQAPRWSWLLVRPGGSRRLPSRS